jgi:hypothetical protein
MEPRSKPQKNKAGFVHARLTTEEQAQVQERSESLGLTVSEWIRETLLAALETSPEERRMMTFIAAQTASIRAALEAWQGNKQLSDATVRQDIEKVAAEMARASAERMIRKLAAVEKLETE